ncbi:nuclease-related domain-containing protein [Demequina soli]|uniref:nuclease-related domain-containing protein n=1 Tax=Demequina soli TaxID=1638987 RepID=UPI00078052CF|nr:nuclease-related domain-containing protein [Demequina soli]
MTDITLNRWTRYGHDRVYAAGPDGARLGYLDLKTGEVTLEPDADASVDDALRDWSESGAPATAQATPDEAAEPATLEPEPEPQEAESPAPEWTDLASTRPGELVRAQAAEAWEREKRAGKVLPHLARALDVHTDERAWRKGAEGEEKVGAVLDRMKKRGWRILHSIPVGENSDIDHLAIGPGGVILVNTKHHPGAKVTVTKYGVMVNGSKTDHAPQARAQAKKAYELLNAAGAEVERVVPWIAVYNGSLLQPEMKLAGRIPGVGVVTNHNINTNLKRLDPVLSLERVEAIYEIARRSTTWTSR